MEVAMSVKKIHISYISRSLLALLWLAWTVNGCAAIDKIVSGPPSPSPTTTTAPSPSPTTTTAPSPSPTTTTAPSSSPIPNVSESSGESNIEKQLDQLVTTKKCLPPNPAEYISGDFKLSWTVLASPYTGFLSMKGRIGKMRIQYFDEDANQSDTVDQIMVLASCTGGLILFGYNPTSASTNQRHPSYSADNLILKREVNGDMRIINEDDQGARVPVEMELISN
jgi:hypothetical protein